MKNTLLLGFTALLCMAATSVFAQATYSGFELWHNNFYWSDPAGYTSYNSLAFLENQPITVTKVTGITGSAVRLETKITGNDTAVGVLATGTFESGGVPYSGQPTTFNGQFRYNIAAGDTASIFGFMLKAGNPVSFIQATFTGSQPTFTQKSITMVPPIMTPDTILLIITSSGSTPKNGSWIEIDSLHFNVTQQLPNPNFEIWNDVSAEDPDGFFTSNFASVAGGFGPSVTKSTDAHSGNFAMKLTTTPVYFDDTMSFAFNGNPFISSNGAPWSGKPAKFTGYYKYSPVGSDSGLAMVTFSRFNTSTMEADSINGEQLRFGPASSYTPFELDFDWTGVSASPDSVSIAFSSSDIDNGDPQLGSALWIDDIAFEFPTGVRVPLYTDKRVRVYPNPATDIVNFSLSGDVEIQVMDLDIYTIAGELVYTEKLPQADHWQIAVRNLVPGSYIYHLHHAELGGSGVLNIQ